MNRFLQLALLGNFDGPPAAVQSVDVAALVLLGLLLFVFLISVVFIWMVSYHARRQRWLAELRPAERPWEEARFRPAFLEPPDRWLAVQTTNPHAVRTALRLHNAAPCSWENGVQEARESRLFISPPVDGWVLVLGARLPDPAEDVDACFRFLCAMSRKLGHVQFFSASRVLGHHAWARLEAGRVLRAYAWAGQTLWHQGPKTAAEVSLGLRCADYGEGAGGNYLEHEAGAWNAERVPLLAARWSLDPTMLDERFTRSDFGIAGDSAAEL
ncbi:MAG: hypothetical protein HZA89_08520 [Verrucomicrobia bacterium]|nr:hypothetical protein [Verrucomicrobiota bacterium]